MVIHMCCIQSSAYPEGEALFWTTLQELRFTKPWRSACGSLAVLCTMQEEAASAGQVNSYSPTTLCWIGASLFNILNYCTIYSTYYAVILYIQLFSSAQKILQVFWTGEKVLTSLSIKFVGEKKHYSILNAMLHIQQRLAAEKVKKQPHNIHSAVTNGTWWKAAPFKSTQPTKNSTEEDLSVRRSCWRWQ